jgi:diguanylate cyclase (GGDEF)-like protein
MPSAAAFAARLNAAQHALNVGDFAAGVELAQALNEDAMAADAWRIAGEAAVVVAKIQVNLQCPEEAERWGERAIAASRLEDSSHVEAVAWGVLATSRAAAEQAGPAMQAVDHCLRHVSDQLPRDVRRAVFTGMALTYDSLGLVQLGLAAARNALEAAWPEDGAAVRSRARVNLLYGALSVHHLLLAVDPPAAAALLQEMTPQLPVLEAECAEVGTGHARASYCHGAGLMLARLGRLDEARARLVELLSLQFGAHARVRRNVWIELACIERQRGDAAATSAAVAQAQSAVDAVGDVHPLARDLHWLVELAEMQGDTPRALALHKRRHALDTLRLLTAFDAHIAGVSAAVSQHSLRLENADLRQRNAGLTATFENLRDLAYTDPLTGLVNRRGLEPAFTALQADCRSLVLAMLDIDHFKQVNDRHSHVVGDEALRRAAMLMQEALRAPDLLVRYGGEEFTLLLADVQGDAALGAVERLRARVSHFDWRSLGLDGALTVSGGVVEVQPRETLAQAVARADALLYRAKAAGRDRVLASPAHD